MVTFSVRLLVRQSVQLSAEERTNEAIELSGYAIHLKILDLLFFDSRILITWKEMRYVLKIKRSDKH